MRGVSDRLADGSRPGRARWPARTSRGVVAAIVVIVAVGVVAAASTMLEPEQPTAEPTRNATEPDPRRPPTTPNDAAAPTPQPTPSPTTGTNPVAPSSASPPLSATEPPLDSATDSTESLSPATVAARFVDAWLTTDPVQRAAGLERWATTALAAALTQTDPNAIPATTRDQDHDPVEVGSSTYSGSYAVDLADGTTVVVDVVDDGAGGWRASQISPADS